LKIPILIHQQDLQAGLANKLMAKTARQITVAFSASLKDYGAQAVVVGNPYLIPTLEKKEIVLARYGLTNEKPLVLIFGGGTGAEALNEAVASKLPELLEQAQIIHLSGRGKMIDKKAPGYCQQEFVSHQELWSLMAAADLVIARPGLGTLTELAALKKVSLLVPMPKTHQEANAEAVRSAGAALVLAQKELNNSLVSTVNRLLTQAETRAALSREMAQFIKPGAAAAIAEIILSWSKKN
jgi:UDP-N-acetylglucosamine--N-acetylmuramyl-(pentapeptide) pyrophosphoryl-undecaprenol N-acetylglucosamine transferase